MNCMCILVSWEYVCESCGYVFAWIEKCMCELRVCIRELCVCVRISINYLITRRDILDDIEKLQLYIQGVTVEYKVGISRASDSAV